MNTNYSGQALAPVFSTGNGERWEPGTKESGRWEELFKPRTVWLIRRYGITMAAMLLLTLWTLTTCAIAAHNARADTIAELEAQFEARIEAFYDEQEEQAAAAWAAYQEDPYTQQLAAEAEALARVLYGVRDNDNDDLRTYCWCVFNRVDNTAYPSTLEDVIAQPQQWMRYDRTNPVLENLYQIAREQLDAWHTGARRPVSSDYVFMSWSSDDICLRDNWAEGSGTHYWRYS